MYALVSLKQLPSASVSPVSNQLLFHFTKSKDSVAGEIFITPDGPLLLMQAMSHCVLSPLNAVGAFSLTRYADAVDVNMISAKPETEPVRILESMADAENAEEAIAFFRLTAKKLAKEHGVTICKDVESATLDFCEAFSCSR